MSTSILSGVLALVFFLVAAAGLYFYRKSNPSSEEANLKVAIWFPFGFCLLLALPQMLGVTGTTATFFGFLPMCFFFVAYTQHSILKRLEEVEHRRSPGADA